MDLQELENELSIIEEKKKEIVKNFENILSDLLSKSIDKDIQAIRWQQYTPSFNDGSPCIFTISDPEILCSSTFADEYNFYATGEESWYYPPGEITEKMMSINESFLKTLKLFANIDPTYFLDCFGNDIQVCFTNNTFTIESWDCGY